MSKGWIKASERLPTLDVSGGLSEVGGFGVVEVITQCNHKWPGKEDKIDRWQVLRLAMPTFLGGDPNRVLWVSADKPHTPIENGAWFVSHWRPFPKFPEPIK